MNFLTNWMKKLAEVIPAPVTFNIVDSTSPKKDVRPLILTIIPPTKDDNRAIVSIYWKDSSEKIYEKAFNTADEAAEDYALHKSNLEMVQKLTTEQKFDESIAALDRIIEECKTQSDGLIDGNPQPVTTTQAAKKEAKVTMQNIFFSTPEEAMEYQKRMKELQGPEENTVLDKVPGQENPDGNLVNPSLSYEDAEKEKEEEVQNVHQQIKEEVKDQIESSLEEKRQTKFTPADETLVKAFRGVGRTWAEIANYLTKTLRYNKEDVIIFVDFMQKEEEKVQGPEHDLEIPIETPTRDEIVDKDAPEVPMDKETSLTRKALDPTLDPLAAPPALPSSIPEGPSAQPVQKLDLKEGDWVAVLSDIDTKKPGFAGTFISTFSRKGVEYAVIEKEDGSFEEVHKHLLTKASLKTADFGDEHGITDDEPEEDSKEPSTIFVPIERKKKLEKSVEMQPAVETPRHPDDLTDRYVELNDGSIVLIVHDSLDGTGYMINPMVKDETGALVFVKKPATTAKPDQVKHVLSPEEIKALNLQDPEAVYDSRTASLKRKADPIKTTPKKHKIIPDQVKPETAIPATPEMEETYRAIQTSEHNLEVIKSLVAEAQAKFNEEKKVLEEAGGRLQNESALIDRIERLAALVEATESKLVSLGDTLVHLKQEDKNVPVKWSDKEKLAHIFKKFPETEKYIENALKGAQSFASSEAIRELIFFPKKKLSKLDKSATPFDTLESIYENLLAALENVMSIVRQCMGDLLTLETLKLVGLPGIIIISLGFALYKLFRLYVETQEKRVQEAQQFQKEYFDLTTDVNKTLDILVKSYGRKNGHEGH